MSEKRTSRTRRVPVAELDLIGLPLADGTRLEYRVNGLSALVVTAVLLGAGVS